MNRNATKQAFRPDSLRRTGSPRTVLLRMAADQERAARIDALKATRPDLTWRQIADRVGVSERSAYNWKVTGGIDYENAKKLAKVFEVDVDFIWRGPAESAPDLSRPDVALNEILAAITAQLAEQTQVLNQIKELLGRDTKTADRLEAATETLGGTAAQLDAQIQETVRALESASRPRTPKARKTAPKRTRPA